MIETLQERAIRILAKAGYTAEPDGKYNGGWLAVNDPVLVLTGGHRRTEYKRVRLHHLDVFKFLNERA